MVEILKFKDIVLHFTHVADVLFVQGSGTITDNKDKV